MTIVNVSLPEPMLRWVEEQVREGDYTSASEYVLDLIRDDRERRDAIVSALAEGEASGVSSRSLKAIIVEAKAKMRDGAL